MMHKSFTWNPAIIIERPKESKEMQEQKVEKAFLVDPHKNKEKEEKERPA